MRLGDSHIMLGTATPEQREHTQWDLPAGHGIYVRVADVDVHLNRAQATGALPQDLELG